MIANCLLSLIVSHVNDKEVNNYTVKRRPHTKSAQLFITSHDNNIMNKYSLLCCFYQLI